MLCCFLSRGHSSNMLCVDIVDEVGVQSAVHASRNILLNNRTVHAYFKEGRSRLE
jgi:hypothetical protein